MASETIHLVQAFVAGRGKSLKSEQPIKCASAAEALRRAERLSPLREGVIAFSMTVDADLGDFDEKPTVLFKSGRLAGQFEDLN
jgi:hypothetical protein